MTDEPGAAAAPPVSLRFVLRHPAHLLAFGFGSGLAARAPGTCGTVAAMAFMPLLSSLPPVAYLLLLGLALALGVVVCSLTSRALAVHDHPGIVWDEFVGYWIGLFLIPPAWYWWLAGFVLFRFFDILKPWPIRWVDRQVHGGLGIMLDDVLAGLMTLACLHLLLRWPGLEGW